MKFLLFFYFLQKGSFRKIKFNFYCFFKNDAFVFLLSEWRVVDQRFFLGFHTNTIYPCGAYIGGRDLDGNNLIIMRYRNREGWQIGKAKTSNQRAWCNYFESSMLSFA
jgi:hypothetical protein